MVDETPEVLWTGCPSTVWGQSASFSAVNCVLNKLNITKIIYEDHYNLNRRFSNFSAQFKQYFALLHRWIVRIHRPARESSDLRNVNRKRDRCIFYSTWVKRVCCVSKISSDCGCQSKEIGVGMEVRLLSVGTRGFFFAASRLDIAAQFCRPQREKNLWHQGNPLHAGV